MIDLELPPLPAYPLDLVADEAPTRTVGPGGAGDGSLSGRVLFGGPLAAPVTAEYVADDPPLRMFVEREAAHAVFHLVHAAVTLGPARAEPPLESVAVELKLSAPTGSGGLEPVAWSMAPQRITDPAEVSSAWRLGPQLGLFGVEASLGSVERTRTRTEGGEVFLEALRLLRSDPQWRLRRTPTMGLAGTQRLVMVVRAPREAPVEVAVTVQAAVRRWRVFRYRTQALQPLVISATI